MKNLALMTVFNTIECWYLIVAYFFGPPCIPAFPPKKNRPRVI